MRREWNAPIFESEREDDDNAAAALAAVSEPRWLEGVQRLILSATENGEKIVVATVRNKYDAAGNSVSGEEGVAGQFRTDGYVFEFPDGGFDVARAVELEGSGASAMLAQELAFSLTPDLCRALTDLKVILDRLGGQAWIAPYFHDERLLGFAFVWDHISKLGRGKEPDAKLAEPLPLRVEFAGELSGVELEAEAEQAEDEAREAELVASLEDEEEPEPAGVSSNGSEPSGS